MSWALKKETFFNLNRFFLIAILACSLLFPFISIDLNSSNVDAVHQPITQLNQIRISYHDALRGLSFERSGTLEPGAHATTGDGSFLAGDWRTMLTYAFLVIYISGIIFCLSKMAWSLWHIRRLIRKHPKVNINGIRLVKIPQPVAPFSFMKYVFVSDELTNSPNFDQVLAHEKVHVHQRHSLDLVFVQLCAAFFWFNPVVWFLAKTLKTVHEYIADKQMIVKGYSLFEYQAMLLGQLINNHAYGLAHNFNLSSVKKRLAMMSIPESGLTGKVRTVLTLVGALVFSALIIQGNALLDAQYSREGANNQPLASNIPGSAASANQNQVTEIDPRIIIVNIGEHSRANVARMVNIINETGPRVVGVDAFFITPRDAQVDKMLADALASTKNLVMAGRFREGSIATSWSNFSERSPLNFANLPVDTANQQVKFFMPRLEVEGKKVYAFAMEVARRYDPESIEEFISKGPTKIDYLGNVGDGTSASNNRFMAIDGDDILERNFEQSFEGKIVIFGFLGKYLGQPDVTEDRFITPLNDSPDQATPDMFGVVVHANIISQILDGR